MSKGGVAGAVLTPGTVGLEGQDSPRVARGSWDSHLLARGWPAMLQQGALEDWEPTELTAWELRT
jgi:hypothetical protein